MKPELIAQVAHEINRAYCASQGDTSQSAWLGAPDWQKQSALAGVAMHLANPDATPEQSHESWLAQKTAEGWAYGEVKDADKKLHPCFLPYAELPAAQKAKDYLFRATVHALKGIADTVVVLEKASRAVIELAADSIAVTYIGRKERFLDHLYGSNLEFVTSQTRALPSQLASQFLRHADMFARAETAPESEVAIQADDDTIAVLAKAKEQKAEDDGKLDNLQHLRDQVQSMDKDSLASFAKVNYRQDVNRKLGVPKMREQVIAMIDQFGVV